MQTPFEQDDIDQIVEQVNLYAQAVSKRIGDLEDEPGRIHEKTELRGLVHMIDNLRSMLRYDTQYDVRTKHRRFNIREFFDLAVELGQMMPQTSFQAKTKQSVFVGHRYDKQRVCRQQGQIGRQKGGRSRNAEHEETIIAAAKILDREITHLHGATQKTTRTRIIDALERGPTNSRITPAEKEIIKRAYGAIHNEPPCNGGYSRSTIEKLLKKSNIPA